MLTMGVDIGSTSSKAVVLKDGKELMAEKVVPIGTGPVGPAKVYQETLDMAGIQRGDIARLVVTGYGRLTFEGADQLRAQLSGGHCRHADERAELPRQGRDVPVPPGPHGR